jgi:hypothetical protein
MSYRAYVPNSRRHGGRQPHKPWLIAVNSYQGQVQSRVHLTQHANHNHTDVDDLFGILPTDTFQDVPMHTIEQGVHPATAGAAQYGQFLRQNPTYPSIQYDFVKQYCAGRALRVDGNLDTYMDQKPNLGPRADGIDFSQPPPSKSMDEYQYPVYRGTTYNPMIALAIVHVAEKNLPFTTFHSALSHLPNVGPTEQNPLWRDDIDFIDKDILHDRKRTDLKIRVVFLPDYYLDGRHAIGFYTRKTPSRRLGAILFTPCTAADLRAAKLWTLFESDGGTGSDQDAAWEDVLVGVSDGEWFHADVVEEYAFWKNNIKVVKDWEIRLALTHLDFTKQIDGTEVNEASAWANERDGRRFWENRCE